MSENSRDRETSGLKGVAVQGAGRDWTVSPGEVLREALEEREMSQSYLAFATGYTQKHINQVVQGRVRISTEAALRFERELDISARFWLHLQADFDLDSARGLHPSRDGSSDSAEPLTTESSPNQKHPNKRAAPLHRDGA